MQKITAHLWFDKEAKEAAAFYTRVFGGKVKSSTVIYDTPSGDCDIVTIDLRGNEFMLISAGPYFKFNPSISFLVVCSSAEEVDGLWGDLSKGGKPLMELGEYPFAQRYGWVADKYGLSWQIMFMKGYKSKQKIIPTLMFVGNVCGRAEEAIKFYASLFNNSKMGDNAMRYGKGEEPDKEGTIKHAGFTLEGQEFAAMDSAHTHNFNFNEAVSLMVHCDTQKEIDHYWNKLSAVKESEQCGWLKDRFGVSWQIVPNIMDKMMGSKDKEKIERVTQAFLKMKKFDIKKLEEAYEGKYANR